MGINKSLLPSGRITNFKPKRSKIPPLTQFIEHGEVSDTETTFRSVTDVKKKKKYLQSILYCTLKSISKLLRHFCARISQVVTHQGSKELH